MSRGTILLLISAGICTGGSVRLPSSANVLADLPVQSSAVVNGGSYLHSEAAHLFQPPILALTFAANKPPQAAPAKPGSGAPAVTPSDYQTLASRGLAIPVLGASARDIQDTFNQTRGANDSRGAIRHEATDIIAPRGAPVVAVEDGVIKKLFTSRWGGLTIYQFDPSGTYCYYYAHLDRYAEGIKEGMQVHRGDKIGYVGSTGDAASPHLHFAIFKLGPEKKWWEGSAINPYSILMGAFARR